MARNNDAARVRDEVYALWTARPPEERRAVNTYNFIDELWNTGVKLGSSQSLHYEHVMSVIRPKIAV